MAIRGWIMCVSLLLGAVAVERMEGAPVVLGGLGGMAGLRGEEEEKRGGGVFATRGEHQKLQASGLVRASAWVGAKQELSESESAGEAIPVQLLKGSGEALTPYRSEEEEEEKGREKEVEVEEEKGRDEVEEVCGPVIEGLETPSCVVVADALGYQLRRYPSGRLWTVATVRDAPSYTAALFKGFLACFNYISGRNSRNETIEMTGPVRIQPLDVKTSSYKIGFFVPAKYKTVKDLPLPEESSIVAFEEFSPGMKAVYGPFGGFPNDRTYFGHWLELKDSLNRDGITYDPSTLMFAGYSSPFQFLNRKQEVWVDVNSDDLASPAAGLIIVQDE